MATSHSDPSSIRSGIDHAHRIHQNKPPKNTSSYVARASLSRPIAIVHLSLHEFIMHISHKRLHSKKTYRVPPCLPTASIATIRSYHVLVWLFRFSDVSFSSTRLWDPISLNRLLWCRIIKITITLLDSWSVGSSRKPPISWNPAGLATSSSLRATRRVSRTSSRWCFLPSPIFERTVLCLFLAASNANVRNLSIPEP